MTLYKLENYKKEILNILFERFDRDKCVVFVFGSHATHEAVKSSDIDIGILCTEKIRADDFVVTHEKLNEEIPLLREIDLVDFATLDEGVRREAIKEIRVWHTGKNCRELLKNMRRR